MQKLLSLLIISILSFFQLSCKKEIDVEFDSRTFTNNKKQWEQLNIKDYSFEYHMGGLVYNIPGTIVVRNGKINKFIPKDDRLPVVLDESFFKYYLTVDDIFRNIENTFSNPIYQKENKNTYWYCHEILVEYDETYFYPKFVAFNHSGKNMFITDTDTNITITRFVAE